MKKIVYFLILSLIFNLFSCTKLISNKSLYDYISNMKEVSSYDKNKTIDDFDSVTLGLIEQYDDRQGEKQGIEWILLYKDNEKALLQSKYIIAIEPYTYEMMCPTYEEYLESDSYEEYNEIGEWLNAQFINYREELIKNGWNDAIESDAYVIKNYNSYKDIGDEKTAEKIKESYLNMLNDRMVDKSPFIYDWLENTFMNEIFNDEEKKIIMPANVSEYNHERKEIIKNRKITLLTFEDSEKYYGKVNKADGYFYDKKATTSTVNNKIKTKATKAVKSFVKNYDSSVIYQKGGNSTDVRLMPDMYYLNTKRTDDEDYIQGAHDAVVGINYSGKYEDIAYNETFHSTSNVFGGGNDFKTIGVAGVRPCMWIDLNKAKSFRYTNDVVKYEDSLVDRPIKKSYNVNDKDLIFIKTIDEYNDDDTIEDFNTITFGKFNDRKENYAYYSWLSNETNDISLEWIPIEKTDNYILLLSKYVLVAEPYNKDGGRCNFEKSSLYEYLNGELVESIFSKDEKKKLLRLNNFNDTMFILNEEMVKKYFSNSKGIYCNKKAATKILPESHLNVNGSRYEHNWNNFNVNYLIDSKGDFDGLVKYVDSNGEINNYGALLDSYKYGIRPAIYLDLHSSSNDEEVNILDKETKEVKRDYSIIYKWSRASISELKNRYENKIELIEIKIASDSKIEFDNNDLFSDESIFFGSYEQDGDLSNGAEDIEWNIIAREDDKVLLLSKYIIESEIVSDNLHMPIYDDTVARNKLIGEYYDKFFNTSEQEIIEQRTLNNFDCPLKKYNKDKTYQSQDKIFLLSLEEIRKYFGDTNKPLEKLKTKSTYYVTDVKKIERKINDVDVKNCFWLRSPGSNEGFASSQPTLDVLFGTIPSFTTVSGDVNNTWALVDYNGQINYLHSYIKTDNSIRGTWYDGKPNYTLKTLAGIRPAIWVNESKLKEYSRNHKINRYVYEDKRLKKSIYEIKDANKARSLSEYSSGYGYHDFDTVKFGKFAFDKTSNKKEDIEWFVLDKSDDQIVLISKYILDDMELWDDGREDEIYTGIVIERTKCFKWLNSNFLYDSFTRSEIDKIVRAINNMKTQHYYYSDKLDVLYDRAVHSKVFLLNKAYLDKYFTYREDVVDDKGMVVNQKTISRDKLLVAEKFGTNKKSSYWLMENVSNGTPVSDTYDFINEIGLVDYDESGSRRGIRPLIIIDAKKIN